MPIEYFHCDYSPRDTIFALSSGRERAAIAVVRISGSAVVAGLQAMGIDERLRERAATLRTLRDPETREALDRAIILRFPGPRSFTGEEMAELHLTGGRAVLAAVTSALGRIPGFRPADPGEFAWRAFENGKLDLVEVEGLADLVLAETAAQRRQALRIAGGALSREADEIRSAIVRAISLVEGDIHFSDMEDAEFPSATHARDIVRKTLMRIQSVLASSRMGERLRDGLNVVIAGPPNVGKSTLMNALSKREVSIVTPKPGTTRDLIEVPMDIKGYPVTLVDTAGIRDTDDAAEREGIRRAQRRVREADLTLWLVECGSVPTVPDVKGAVIFVETKSDQSPPGTKIHLTGGTLHPALSISAKTGEGISRLVDEISTFAVNTFDGSSAALITTQRHKIAFSDASIALERFLDPESDAVELGAEELRLAARAMERIVGRIDVEEVLAAIFSRLCVGK